MNDKSLAPTTVIPSRAWYGDEDLALTFPPGWQVTTLWPNDAPPIDEGAIERAFVNPIGSPTIAEAAAGRRSAVIVLDDLSRPTPAALLIPTVLRQLTAAGIPHSEIRFVIGGGSHRPQTAEEMVKKVGHDVVANFQVTSHDCYSGNLRGIGNLPDGLPLYFDPVVADADFKMTIGGIYPHGAVGFGGGSKLILPGVAGFATMFQFHSLYPVRGQAVIERVDGPPDHRDASEAAAEALGLDLVVNAVINSRREIAGLFVGDFIQAHRAGARFALQTYGTVIPKKLRREADVIVVNAYPLDSDPIQTSKALWAKKYFQDAYTVAVNPACDGICYHGLYDRIDWHRYSQNLVTRPPMADPEPIIDDIDQVLLWSENFPIQELDSRLPKGVLFRKWRRLIEQLAAKVPTNAKVAVFPCSGIQVLAE